jgi:hypothetical protein
VEWSGVKWKVEFFKHTKQVVEHMDPNAFSHDIWARLRLELAARLVVVVVEVVVVVVSTIFFS